MFKLLVALAVLAVYVNCNGIPGGMPGGITKLDYVPAEVEEFARQSMNQIAGLTRFDGSYTLLRIRNCRSQVVAGIKYYFTIDVLTQPRGSTNYGGKTCEVTAVFASWKTPRVEIMGQPSCVENPGLVGALPLSY